MKWPFVTRRRLEDHVAAANDQLEARGQELTAAWHQMEKAKREHASEMMVVNVRLRKLQAAYDSMTAHLPRPEVNVVAYVDLSPSAYEQVLSVQWSIEPTRLRCNLEPEVLRALRERDAFACEYRQLFRLRVLPKIWEQTAAAINKAVGAEVFPPSETWGDS